jgi:hypothetical protein
MRERTMACLMACTLMASGATLAAESKSAASVAFERLATLQGTWDGKFADGRAHSVTYRLTAGGSTLVETWALAPGRESMTLYHLAGDDLLATHYCPQGNQPRLKLKPGKDGERLDFEILDGSNLDVAGGAHQHSFWVEVTSKDEYRRGETYVENGSSAAELADAGPGEAIVYTRSASVP